MKREQLNRQFKILVLKALVDLQNAVILGYCHRGETSALKDELLNLADRIEGELADV